MNKEKIHCIKQINKWNKFITENNMPKYKVDPLRAKHHGYEGLNYIIFEMANFFQEKDPKIKAGFNEILFEPTMCWQNGMLPFQKK